MSMMQNWSNKKHYKNTPCADGFIMFLMLMLNLLMFIIQSVTIYGDIDQV